MAPSAEVGRGDLSELPQEEPGEGARTEGASQGGLRSCGLLTKPSEVLPSPTAPTLNLRFRDHKSQITSVSDGGQTQVPRSARIGEVTNLPVHGAETVGLRLNRGSLEGSAGQV